MTDPIHVGQEADNFDLAELASGDTLRNVANNMSLAAGPGLTEGADEGAGLDGGPGATNIRPLTMTKLADALPLHILVGFPRPAPDAEGSPKMDFISALTDFRDTFDGDAPGGERVVVDFIGDPEQLQDLLDFHGEGSMRELEGFEIDSGVKFEGFARLSGPWQGKLEDIAGRLAGYIARHTGGLHVFVQIGAFSAEFGPGGVDEARLDPTL